MAKLSSFLKKHPAFGSWILAIAIGFIITIIQSVLGFVPSSSVMSESIFLLIILLIQLWGHIIAYMGESRNNTGLWCFVRKTIYGIEIAIFAFVILILCLGLLIDITG